MNTVQNPPTFVHYNSRQQLTWWPVQYVAVICIRATQFNIRLRKARVEQGCSVKMLKKKERKKERQEACEMKVLMHWINMEMLYN